MGYDEFLWATTELRVGIRNWCSRSRAVVFTHGNFPNFLVYGSFHLPKLLVMGADAAWPTSTAPLAKYPRVFFSNGGCRVLLGVFLVEIQHG